MQITDIKGAVELSNGYKMPYLGLGTFKINDGEDVENAVKYGLEAGYRHIDTAAMYLNEKGIGNAIKESNISREEIFATTKLWNSDHGYDNTLKAFERSMERLDLEYLDLYLIHWPVQGKFKDTWKAFEKLYNDGKIKAIGVSNFQQYHIEELVESCKITPMVNQVEFHPYLVQQELLDFCKHHNIICEAWSPLMQGRAFTDETLKQIARKYNKDVAQLIIRWNLQKGLVTIPKSSKRERVISNAMVFDFEISKDDVQKIDSLDKNMRFGPDPDNFDF